MRTWKGDRNLRNLFDIKPKEKDIKREIRGYLRVRGIWHYPQWQGQFSERGVSDLCGIYKGKPLYIEVKVPGYRTNTKTFEGEKVFLERAEAEGAICIIATSVEQVMEKLK